jgi:hypothetical protein
MGKDKRRYYFIHEKQLSLSLYFKLCNMEYCSITSPTQKFHYQYCQEAIVYPLYLQTFLQKPHTKAQRHEGAEEERDEHAPPQCGVISPFLLI